MKVPSVGDYIYLPTIGDFLIGGRVKITEVLNPQGGNTASHYISVGGRVNMCFRWEDGVAEMQEELKSKFGKKRARRTGVKLSCPLRS